MGAHQDAAARPAKADLQREFPGWHIWEGIAGLKYGRKLNFSPPRVVRADSWADLRDLLATPADAVRGSGGHTAVPAAPSPEGEQEPWTQV